MGYDLHVVRTRNWLDAENAPITKADVDTLVASDPELEWSASDYISMRDDVTGAVTNYFMTNWRGEPCFWWYRDQIECSGPNDEQLLKLVQIAGALNAYAVGDDGERYEITEAGSVETVPDADME